jgi:hypothetical protein
MARQRMPRSARVDNADDLMEVAADPFAGLHRADRFSGLSSLSLRVQSSDLRSSLCYRNPGRSPPAAVRQPVRPLKGAPEASEIVGRSLRLS